MAGRPKPKPKTKRKWIYADGRGIYFQADHPPLDIMDVPVGFVDERQPVEPAPPNRKQRRAAAARERHQ